MPVEAIMKTGLRVVLSLLLFALLSACAGQEPAPDSPEESPSGRPGPTVSFLTGDGTRLTNGQTITLATGGSPDGRLIPQSDEPDATLYVTRDGSLPSPQNSWSGPIDPADPPVISATLESAATYAVVAVVDSVATDPVTVRVLWEHEEDPDVAVPVFSVGGSSISGSVTIPVSDGDDPATRLAIECNYIAATLFITRDGSPPSADNFWESRRCDGTYIWSPEPTAADYRVIAVWQGVSSPVARLAVTWEASE